MSTQWPAASLLRSPWTWLPVILSAAALGLLVAYALTTEPVTPPTGDERAPARIFQLLLALDAIAIVAFGVRWLPRRAGAAGVAIGLQVLAAAVPILVVLALESR